MSFATTLSLSPGSAFGWYLTRDAAITAYVALTVTVLLGIARPLAQQLHISLSWIVDEVHRMAAILTMVATAVHLTTVVTNGMVQFTWLDVLVPGPKYGSHTLPANLGIVGLYALLVVIGSSLVKRHLKYELWHRLHLLSFLAFVAVTAHGCIAGSDTGTPFMQTLYPCAVTAVSLLVFLRIVLARAGSSTHQPQGISLPETNRHE